jgi:hypothetical protein
MEKVREKNGGNPNFRVNETLKDHRNYDTNKTKRKISEWNVSCIWDSSSVTSGPTMADIVHFPVAHAQNILPDKTRD